MNIFQDLPPGYQSESASWRIAGMTFMTVLMDQKQQAYWTSADTLQGKLTCRQQKDASRWPARCTHPEQLLVARGGGLAHGPE